MKKALMLLAVTAFALLCVPAFSQTARADPKDAFAKTVPIVKIYSHNLGYKVLYFTSKNELAEMYVPMKWFAPGVEHRLGQRTGVPQLFHHLGGRQVRPCAAVPDRQLLLEYVGRDRRQGARPERPVQRRRAPAAILRPVPVGIHRYAGRMLDIEGTRSAIREEGLDGWLFLTLQHRDEIADAALGIGRERMNSRPWAYVIPAEGPPVAIVHEIEPTILEHLPGRATRYHAREAFIHALAKALPRGSRIAAQFSLDIPIGSFLDHGTALLLQGLGVILVSSANLVARCLGALDEAAVRSHEAAAEALYAAVPEAWARVAQEIGGGARVREGDVQGWIAARLAAAGMVSEGPPLVAAGTNSANPHYEIAGGGAWLEPGQVVQLDVWAREDSSTAVYADISWVGVLGREPAAEQRAAFDAIVQARESAIDLISRSLAEGREVRGRDVDEAARACLAKLGFAGAVRHRTGHSIGHRVHGYGVNLDCIEFPDDRPLREGACFSIEPGVYLEGFGMRTEVDGLIRGGALSISGSARQRALLTLG